MKNNKSVEKRHFFYIDYLRIIAILAVIAVHCTDNSFKGFYKLGTSMFLLITGAFFLAPSFKFNLVNVVFKRAVAFVLFTTIYFFLKYDTNTVINKLFIEYYFTEIYHHLWYIVFIIGVYFLMPIFRIITRNITIKEYNYLLIIFALFIVVPEVMDTLKLSFNIYGLYILKVFPLVPFQIFGTLFLGYYLHALYPFSSPNKVVLFFIFILFSILSIYVMDLKDVYFYRERFSSIFIISASALLMLFKDIDLFNKPNKFISLLAKQTFFIYMFHMIILTKLKEYIYTNEFITFIVVVILSFMVSLLVYKFTPKKIHPYFGF